MITIDTERYLELLDRLKTLEAELRQLGSKGYSSAPSRLTSSTPPRQPREDSKDESPAMSLDLDISGIEWKRSNKAGGGVAGPGDGWA